MTRSTEEFFNGVAGSNYNNPDSLAYWRDRAADPHDINQGIAQIVLDEYLARAEAQKPAKPVTPQTDGSKLRRAA